MDVPEIIENIVDKILSISESLVNFTNLISDIIDLSDKLI
tara:strand:+ start:13 stop:132 length:120 start_codon:yes stop_codon:yes gene_type:complete